MAPNILTKKNEDELKQITDTVVNKVLNNNNLTISKIILYGSYARGTADHDSDIDIMILCDNSNEEAVEFSKDVFRSVDEVAYEHDIMIQTNIKNKDYFYEWVDYLPYFHNVNSEGVVIYGGS